MKETKMYDILLDLIPWLFIQRIENTLDLGTPDAVYGLNYVTGLLEAKQLSRIPVHKFKVPFRPGQYAWYKRYAERKTGPYTLLLTIVDDWYIVPKSAVQEYYTMEEINHFHYGKTKELVNNRTSVIIALGGK